MMRRRCTIGRSPIVVVLVTTGVVAAFGNDGGGCGCSCNGDVFAWLNVAVGVKSVCCSLVNLCLFSTQEF